MNIAVLDAGTWGTAIARLLFLNGSSVSVWTPIQAEADELNSRHKHPNLPDADIPEGIAFSTDMEDTCRCADVIIFAVPSVFIRDTAKKINTIIKGDEILVCVSKGLEDGTLMTLTSVIRDELKSHDGLRLVALSGPSHAEEVSAELPTTLVAASPDAEAAGIIQRLVSNDYMRVYTNPDIEGVEICGALKNIIALAVGISTGMGYGDNARAAIITRGISEISALGRALNCNEHTFYGLTGVGDLIVTATSKHSRNNKAGYLIGKGLSLEEAGKEVGMVIEGANALPAALKLAQRCGVETPIISAVNEILFCNGSPAEIAHDLITRKYKSEYDH